MKTQKSLEDIKREITQDQDHINKVALQAILKKHLEESKQHLSERKEFYEGKIAAYHEILHLLHSDTGEWSELEER